MVDSKAKPTGKQMRALALRRTSKTWSQVASTFGTSQRCVKRWVKQALLIEQQVAA